MMIAGMDARIRIGDAQYPPLLKEIPDPPALLWVRGADPAIFASRCIAVVGTRRMTEYGASMTRTLVTDLVRLGYVIVSGMAAGIDTVAHRTAIAAGGKTVAVLGCGIDIIAPAVNASLYRAIAGGGGCIVTEIAPGIRTPVTKFVTRNRIISGLSLGVVVVEGSGYSGSLITAKYAAEQGREVFAVPGPVTSPTSRAPAILLKNGAKLVESAGDIIEELCN